MALGTPPATHGRTPPSVPRAEPRRVVTLVPRTVVLLLFLAVIAVTLSFGLLRESVPLQQGSVCPQDFAAPRTGEDTYKTAELRRQAAAAVPDYYRFEPQAAGVVAAYLDKMASDVTAVLSDATLDLDARSRALAEKLPGEPSAQVVALVAGLDAQTWTGAGLAVRDAAVEVMGTEFDASGLAAAKQQLASELARLPVAKELGQYLTAVAQRQLTPTLVLDPVETERRRSDAANAVAPVMILKDQIIARRGEILTEHQVSLIQDMALLRASLEPRAVAGSILLAAILVGSVVLYLALYEGDVFKNASQLLLLAIVVSLVLLVTQLTKGISPYLAPVALGTMLISSLLGPRLALFVAFVLSVGVGLTTGTDLRHALVALTGGMAGVYSLSWIGQRSEFTRAGLLVGLANVIAIVAFDLTAGVSLANFEAWRELGFGFLNGIASAVLTIGTLPFFESAFGVLTSVRLLELANPNQPLLRRLLVEAPGTYHHSVVVGNLAEAGADVVGGNQLLARVGAYYHDIGKIVRPYFFIENQMGQENPHDKISPSLSALIITSHVKDGVTLAEEAKLPPQVISFIRSHHGRSLVSYFFNRASENGQVGRLGEEDFRYDGPLPETREEALVMLADSCEAAVRAMPEPDSSRIETLVRRIIRERLVDGQLERCDLTLKDLDKVADVFSRILVGIFHARIEYPQDSERLMKEIKEGEMKSAGNERAEPPAGPAEADEPETGPEPEAGRE